ncbi:MAG: hypothetical protein CO119_07210 [Flavobacteriales bacterium CG_4_9_14_3_um_filter_40_17]|nr:MAG: hypothetical protein CO119_07210 [Flavobacteriales bacterium CG_4_9_14_3_um_filter_40_17]
MNRGNGNWEYQNSQYNGSSSEYVWVSSGTSSGYSKNAYTYGERDYATNSERYLDERPDKKPDYELLVDKKKLREQYPCVYEALMGLVRYTNDPLKPEIFQEAIIRQILNNRPRLRSLFFRYLILPENMIM